MNKTLECKRSDTVWKGYFDLILIAGQTPRVKRSMYKHDISYVLKSR